MRRCMEGLFNIHFLLQALNYCSSSTQDTYFTSDLLKVFKAMGKG